jgi:hypothetical protein
LTTRSLPLKWLLWNQRSLKKLLKRAYPSNLQIFQHKKRASLISKALNVTALGSTVYHVNECISMIYALLNSFWCQYSVIATV